MGKHTGLSLSSGVYEIVNLVNGKRYIGSAFSFSKRWSKHRLDLSRQEHHSPHLQRSWNKYGATEFSFRVLEVVEDRSTLLQREQFYLNTMAREYNCSGTAGSRQGMTNSPRHRARLKAAFAKPEVRAKLGSGKRGVPHTEEHKAHMREMMTGRKTGPRLTPNAPISQETRQKMRAAKLGTKRSPEAIAKGAAASAIARTGQKRTDEQRARMADAARNRTDANRYVPPAGVRPEHLFSAEVAAKRVAAQTGLKRTPEQCARIADAKRKYTPEEMVIRRRASVKACKDRAKAKRLVDRLAE